MRLLHATRLFLQDFADNQVPPYSILSHLWGDEEITHQDFVAIRKVEDPRYAAYHELLKLDLTRTKESAGYKKIEGACAKAASDGWEWLWIDTCCVDKTTSAELQETINSMFQWYRRAKVCYAYLADVDTTIAGEASHPNWREMLHQFPKSRWFTRGWTLQEMLAPVEVQFLNSYWEKIGSKGTLANEITSITGIPRYALYDSQTLSQVCVAEKMSWAANRSTTRVEDVAYSLLGVFDINMPLLYGEGSKAFLRLQEEIIKNVDDDSIYSWHRELANSFGRSEALLSDSPNEFAHSDSKKKLMFDRLHPHIITSRGLRMDVYLLEIPDWNVCVKNYPQLRDPHHYCVEHRLIPLHCTKKDASETPLALLVGKTEFRSRGSSYIYLVHSCADIEMFGGRLGLGRPYASPSSGARREVIDVRLRRTEYADQ